MAKLCWTVESAVPSVPVHRIRSSGLNLISWNILEINSLGLNGLLAAGMGSGRKLCTFIPLSFFPRVKGHHPGMLGTWFPLITSNRDSFPRSPLRKVLPFHLLLGNEGNVFQSTPFLFPWAAKEGGSSLCPAPPPFHICINTGKRGSSLWKGNLGGEGGAPREVKCWRWKAWWGGAMLPLSRFPQKADIPHHFSPPPLAALPHPSGITEPVLGLYPIS